MADASLSRNFTAVICCSNDDWRSRILFILPRKLSSLQYIKTSFMFLTFMSKSNGTHLSSLVISCVFLVGCALYDTHTPLKKSDFHPFHSIKTAHSYCNGHLTAWLFFTSSFLNLCLWCFSCPSSYILLWTSLHHPACTLHSLSSLLVCFLLCNYIAPSEGCSLYNSLWHIHSLSWVEFSQHL